ncbi:MAG: hypothetical protein CL974_00035, partial [Euryarchaeota archaeon]|nr:hypothetical protein [Euryarchaeota archaeon]
MAQTVKLKRTSVAGRNPTTSNIEVGELAFNSNDKSLFIRGDSSAIVTLHDESTLHINNTNNRVGIGQTSPAFTFHVDSGTSDWPAYFKSTDNKAGIIVADNDTTAYFGAESDRAFMGIQAGIHANNLNVDSSGKVGIGTTSPSKRLHVEDSSAYQLQLDGGNNFWNVGAGWSGYYDG